MILMKTLVLSLPLLVATGAFAQLSPATGDRLTDYQAWFDGFAVASDANYTTTPHPPSTSTPIAGSTSDRDWTGWKTNWGSTALTGPITNIDPKYNLKVEVVFLGETAGWWDDLGIRLNGVDGVLADSVQAAGSSPNRLFGDWANIYVAPGGTLDFFVTGTGIFGSNPGLTPGGATGGRYYALGSTPNIPASATMQSYWGRLGALTTVRTANEGMLDVPFTVLGFEDIQSNMSDRDYNDIVFAYRASLDIPQGGVPEPSTYGLLGAVLLLLVAEYRRRKA